MKWESTGLRRAGRKCTPRHPTAFALAIHTDCKRTATADPPSEVHSALPRNPPTAIEYIYARRLDLGTPAVPSVENCPYTQWGMTDPLDPHTTQTV